MADPQTPTAAPAVNIPAFVPINTPPSDYDPPATGLSTEKGDSFKAAMEKVNAGFAHVYTMLTGTAPVAVSNAAKSAETASSGAWKALEARITALESGAGSKAGAAAGVAEADFAALKARVEGLAASAGGVAAGDFEKVKADLASMTERFESLAQSIEAFLGLKKK